MTPAQLARARASGATALGYSLRKLQEAKQQGALNQHVGAGVEYGALSQRLAILNLIADAPDLPTAVEWLAADLQKFSAQVME